MRRFLTALCLFMLLVANACSGGGEPVELKFNFAEGETYLLECDAQCEITFFDGDSTTSGDVEFTAEFSFEVEEVEDSGRARLNFSLDAVRADASAMGAKFNYDTDKGNKPRLTEMKVIAMFMDAVVNTGGTFSIKPTGEITEGEGWPESIKDHVMDIEMPDAASQRQFRREISGKFNQQNTEQVFELFFGTLPRQPLSVGERATVKVDNPAPMLVIEPIRLRLLSYREPVARLSCELAFQSTNTPGFKATGKGKRTGSLDTATNELTGTDSFTMKMIFEKPGAKASEREWMEIRLKGDWTFEKGAPPAPEPEPESEDARPES